MTLPKTSSLHPCERKGKTGSRMKTQRWEQLENLHGAETVSSVRIQPCHFKLTIVKYKLCHLRARFLPSQKPSHYWFFPWPFFSISFSSCWPGTTGMQQIFQPAPLRGTSRDWYGIRLIWRLVELHGMGEKSDPVNFLPKTPKTSSLAPENRPKPIRKVNLPIFHFQGLC